MTASVDDYRVVVDALDRIEASAIASGPLPMGPQAEATDRRDTRARRDAARRCGRHALRRQRRHAAGAREREKSGADETKPERSPAEDRDRKDREENRGHPLRQATRCKETS
jgi:hypothetical protein